MQTRLHPWALAAVLLLLSVAYFLIYHAPILSDPLHFNDDVVQHYLWLYDTHWADDFYARASGALQPWGFYALLWSLGRFAEPLTIAAYGPLLITFLTAWFTVGLLRPYLPLIIAVAGAFLALQYTMHTTVGFLARAFSAPLLAMFAYFLMRGSRRGVAGTLVLCSLFYPPALLVNGCILLIWELGALLIEGKAFRLRPALPGYLALLAGGLLSVTIVLAHSYVVHDSPDLGPFFSHEELLGMPEFGSRGRVVFSDLTQTSIRRMGHYYIRIFFGKWPAPDFGLFVLAVACVLGAVHYKKLGRPGVYLLLFALATAALYEAARLMAPLLFLADRYVLYPWRWGVPVVITFVVGGLYHLYPRRWSAVLLAAGIVAIAVLHRRPAQQPHVDMAHFSTFWDYLKTLPEQAMIAAPPMQASYIPLIAERSVVLSHESAHALYLRDYYNYVTPRYRDYVMAVTAPADSLDQVITFLDRYGADYLVVDRRMPESWIQSSFAPHQQSYNERVAGRDSSDFAVLHIPDSLGVSLGNYLVVPREALRGLIR